MNLPRYTPPNQASLIPRFPMTGLPISSNNYPSNSFSKVLCKKRSSFSLKFLHPINSYRSQRPKVCSFNENELNLRAFNGGWSLIGVRREKDGTLLGRKKRVVVVKVNQFGFNGGGPGGGGGDNGNNARVLGNLALAIGLTYLTMTDQLGWVLDTIVSLWLLAIILPIAGLGAFLWWAGQNIVQNSCPNCGKEFQIFRSSEDDVQLCPFCTQPFSSRNLKYAFLLFNSTFNVHQVEGNEFVRKSGNFTSKESTTFGKAFSGFSSSSKKATEKASSLSVVDIEAEVKDVE